MQGSAGGAQGQRTVPPPRGAGPGTAGRHDGGQGLHPPPSSTLHSPPRGTGPGTAGRHDGQQSPALLVHASPCLDGRQPAPEAVVRQPHEAQVAQARSQVPAAEVHGEVRPGDSDREAGQAGVPRPAKI